MTRFHKQLHAGRVLLMDGAMGTELIRAGLDLETDCAEQWNFTHPERVAAVHQAYAAAGAEVLLTNTFQANPSALERLRLRDQLQPIASAAVELARAAAKPDGFVLLALGPAGPMRLLKQWHLDWVRALAPALLQVDGVVLETFTNPFDLFRLGSRIRRFSSEFAHLPIFASFTYAHNPNGPLVSSFRDRRFVFRWEPAMRRLTARRVWPAVGVNCGRDLDLDDVRDVIRQYRTMTELPLFARPNAGTPTQVDGEWVYPLPPATMAARLPDLLAAGVAMIGGCCGTTPEHIAACRVVVDAWNSRQPLIQPGFPGRGQ